MLGGGLYSWYQPTSSDRGSGETPSPAGSSIETERHDSDAGDLHESSHSLAGCTPSPPDSAPQSHYCCRVPDGLVPPRSYASSCCSTSPPSSGHQPSPLRRCRAANATASGLRG